MDNIETSTAQTMQGHDDTGKLDRVRARIAGWIEAGEIRGAALAVAQGGEQVAELHFGEAAPGQCADERTLWPLASISKVYSGAMIMALVEEGELILSMPVNTVVEEFTGGSKDQVRLRHLLTHTSGMIYESPAHEKRLRELVPYDELLDESYLYPLLFEPGDRVSYSDYGVALATRVAERVTGRDRADLIRQYVSEPAGLNDTFFRLTDQDYDRLAHVEGTPAAGSDGAMYTTRHAIDLAHPSFGAITTIGDLLRFALLFAPAGKQRILSRAAIRTMTTDQTGGHTPGGVPGLNWMNRPMPWGITFMIATPDSFSPDLLTPGSFGHGGASGCTVWVDPVQDLAIAFVSNKHAGTGRIPFTKRLVSTVNGVAAALTRD